jgi:hypothetical protein
MNGQTVEHVRCAQGGLEPELCAGGSRRAAPRLRRAAKRHTCETKEDVTQTACGGVGGRCGTAEGLAAFKQASAADLVGAGAPIALLETFVAPVHMP